MMKFTQLLVLLFAVASSPNNHCHAFSTPVASSSRIAAAATNSASTVKLAAEPAPGGTSTTVAEEEDADSDAVAATAPSSSSESDESVSATKRVGINSRGAKMNEIDFTLAPTDVSLSRSYQMIKDNNGSSPSPEAETSQSLSLTRALNTASNRAVRRILLSRSWPSAEALNLSLRTVLMQQQQKEEIAKAGLIEGGDTDKVCPVPRPILNVLMNRKDTSNSTSPVSATAAEREQQWIQNQIADFRESYSAMPNFNQAEAYLESVLSLATSGTESERVADVVLGGLYVDPYLRILSVIQSVGAVLEEAPGGGGSDGSSKLRRVAKKLIDQDICLSMLDKIALANERKKSAIEEASKERVNPVAIPYDAAARLAYDADPSNQSMSFDEFKVKYESDTVAMVSLKWKQSFEEESSSIENTKMETKEKPKKSRLRRLASWVRGSNVDTPPATDSSDDIDSDDIESSPSSTSSIVINSDDLGGVLLSAEEPSMTRQLNVLSNIVQRTLIFGGDQELLVLSETLDADKPAFIQRWYKNDPAEDTDIHTETRPGVQYLNSLILILRECYTKGVLTDVTPTLPLTKGYQNAYGRLTASLIELGSGYVRPSSSSALLATAATEKLSSTTPKSVREELGRFAQWESAVRKNSENPYPDDLLGTWSVQDVVGTQTIGTTDVIFEPQGELSVKPPMQGLRWRLDPGPTHLDTCTFQVLSDDGAILQYKGFVDRGSRLEARVSKRSVTMRGFVSFLMRSAEGYYDDMVPMNFNSGTTKFIMSRNASREGSGPSDMVYSKASTAKSQGALKCPPVAEGEREIIYGPDGPILVTKVAGSYYAIDATCPHLGLPMKKGKITVEEGKQPTLTCSFHNSCFEMKTGKCTKWVTGALGNENEVIAGVMSNLGSEQKDVVAYQVSEEADGTLTVTADISEMSKIAA